MKLSATDAEVTTVTSIGENHREEIVPAISIRLEADILPRHLNTFSKKLLPLFFEDDIPTIPELGEIKWTPEYEKAQFTLKATHLEESVQFHAADIKKIAFTPKAGFLVHIALSVKLNADERQRGIITGLVKQKVSFTIEKATQVRIDERRYAVRAGRLDHSRRSRRVLSVQA